MCCLYIKYTGLRKSGQSQLREGKDRIKEAPVISWKKEGSMHSLTTSLVLPRPHDLHYWHPLANAQLLVTYLLTQWSRILLEKLTGSQPVKKFPTFYGTRRFIIAFTCARHLSLPCASSIQSMPPHPTSWRYILILSSHLRLGLPGGLFPSVSHQNSVYASPLSHTRYMPSPIPFFSILSHEQYWVKGTDH